MLNSLFKSLNFVYYGIIIVYCCVYGQALDWNVQASKYKNYGAFYPYLDLNFCNKSCTINNKTQVLHVGCKCNNVGIEHLDCVSYMKKYTVEMRLFLTQRLNVLRNVIVTSSGPIRRHFPTPSDMRAINYDIGLEYMARCTANRCALQHDPCRATVRHGHVQQLIFLMRSGKKITLRNIVDKALKTWLSTKTSSPTNVTNNTVVGNWTAWEILVWNKATHIGCSTKYLARKKPYQIFFVCNIAGTKNPGVTNVVYRVGRPCQDCNRKFPCSRELPGLCGKVGDVPISALPRFRNDSPNFQSTKLSLFFILIYVLQ